MGEKRTESYVIVPRYIVRAYRNGEISIPERNLLFWIRACGNPYGIADVDLELLSRESFSKKVDKSYINRLLLSLKSKRFIWYKERKGCRGSFEVHLDYWVTPDGTIRSLAKYFEQDKDRSEGPTDVSGGKEVGMQTEHESQRFDFQKKHGLKGNSLKQVGSLVRAYDTDTDKDKDNETMSGSTNKIDFSIRHFVPKSSEEQRCLEIALEIGDDSVGFCIGIYKKYGLRPLESALNEFRKVDKSTIKNGAKYFNVIVQKYT